MFAKHEATEIFPTTIWVVDLSSTKANRLNAQLKTEIETIISPRPRVPVGSNWQTPQDLHRRPAFAEFVQCVEAAALGATRDLGVDQYPMRITGCWANINPPGAYHPTHNHPNNFLSGAYYVAMPEPGCSIQFQDPRPIAFMPRRKDGTNSGIGVADARSREGRMVLFPSWLRHHVPINDSQSDRISIAFNLMFERFAETTAESLPSAGHELPLSGLTYAFR
jgi:uncharacterized protein (TIGR02466 family)